jgi:hypothetical protein
MEYSKEVNVDGLCNCELHSDPLTQAPCGDCGKDGDAQLEITIRRSVKSGIEA